jgi:predicted dithiol-disulfide oxidoreductase (DUF899 family)
MSIPTSVVSEQEWNRAREALLAKEKELAAEDLASVWGLLDVTPFGRQEDWQDAPEGVPQDPVHSWARRHDEYTAAELAGGRTG